MNKEKQAKSNQEEEQFKSAGAAEQKDAGWKNEAPQASVAEESEEESSEEEDQGSARLNETRMPQATKSEADDFNTKKTA